MALQHIPCAPGGQIGEQITREYLMKHLTEGVLLTNYHHPVGNGTDEHDLLLINRRGVWALEVKHWFGRIDADDIYWAHNSRQHPSPIGVIESKAKVIASALAANGFANTSVVGMVILTRHESKFGSKPSERHQRKIFRLTQPLLDAVTGREYLFNPSKNRELTPGEMDRVADILVQRKIDPQRQVVANFRLMRELEPGDSYRVFEAQHIRIATNRARAKRYQIDLSGFSTKAELQEAVTRFEQDIHALTHLQGHSNIVRAYDFFADAEQDDIYWLLLEWIEGGTLRDRLDDDEPLPFREQVRILRALTSALAACHSEGILHRNLSPASVYLADDGTVKLGDFDFARVPTISRTLTKTGVAWAGNRYMALELKSDPRHADHRADFYALGAIWYDMALRPAADEPIMLSRLKQIGLSEDASAFLRSLLSSRPGDRPEHAQEVNEYLELLHDEM